MTAFPPHQAFDEILEDLVRASGVSRSVLASVLVRAMVVAPDDAVRADIARGTMLGRPRALNPSAVSRAVASLVDLGLLSEGPLQSDKDKRAGRPVKPIRLGSRRWGLLGIKIVHANSRPTALSGVIMTLRTDVLVEKHVKLPKSATFRNVAEHVQKLVQKLEQQLAQDMGEEAPRRMLAAGVEVASHVKEGVLIGATHMGLPIDTDYDLLGALRERLHLPVVVDNDVNVLAVRELYRSVYKERDIAIIAVFTDGVGGALIVDGRVYRGGGGMAAEPGHQKVHIRFGEDAHAAGAATPGSPSGFAAPCHCGKAEHVDCYSVPARILAEIPNAKSFAEAAESPGRLATGELTRAGWAFSVGGEALGQAVASLVNIVNPSRVVLVLPASLSPHDAAPGSAAREYLHAAENAVTEYSFSMGANDARAGLSALTVEVLDEEDVRKVGARSAAIRAFDAFIAHARGLDECKDDTTGFVRDIA
ncbi:ROK family protein [Arthrobacter sp. OAP107]|uniref:ROK family protein n=1 Tax=Arthrobacter sp. OAP107 TaxID=3156445 RepID=UPI00339583CF